MRGRWVVCWLLLCPAVWAYRTEKPPVLTLPVESDDVALLNKSLADFWDLTNGRYTLDVELSNPNGSRLGDRGDMVNAFYGGANYLCVNTSTPKSGKTWTCLNITSLSGGSTTPGGADTQVQFNDAGAFGGDSGFTFAKATDAVDINGHTAIGGDASVDQTWASNPFDNFSYPSQVMNVRETITDETVRSAGLISSITVNPTNSNVGSGGVIGAGIRTDIPSTNGKSLEHSIGAKFESLHNGTGTMTELYGLWSQVKMGALSGFTRAGAGYFLSNYGNRTGSGQTTVFLENAQSSSYPTNPTISSPSPLIGLFIGPHERTSNSSVIGSIATSLAANFVSRSGLRTSALYSESLNYLEGPTIIGPSFASPAKASLHIRNNNFAHEITGSGTIVSSGTTVTGSSTTFVDEIGIGSTGAAPAGTMLEANGEEIQVLSVTSDTSLTVQQAFRRNLPAGTTFKIKRPSLLLEGDGPRVDGTCSGCGAGDTTSYSFVVTQGLGRVGINSKYPSAALEVSGISGTSNNYAINVTSGIVVVGDHVHSTGTAPVISACGGGTPSVVGTDMVGKITMGTGIVTSCTMTFNTVWTNAPSCVANDETNIVLVRTATTTSTMTLSTAGSVAGETISYLCLGRE